MEKLFIPYELALLAKEKGFNEECLGYYSYRHELIIGSYDFSVGYPEFNCIAPLYQQIIDWFREKIGYHIYVRVVSEDKYEGVLHGMIKTGNKPTYYQALNEAITEPFKLI